MRAFGVRLVVSSTLYRLTPRGGPRSWLSGRWWWCRFERSRRSPACSMCHNCTRMNGTCSRRSVGRHGTLDLKTGEDHDTTSQRLDAIRGGTVSYGYGRARHLLQEGQRTTRAEGSKHMSIYRLTGTAEPII